MPGLKNELCDYLSRHAFDAKIDENFEKLVKDAFVKMDSQLDLWLRQILLLNDKFQISEVDYIGSRFDDIWKTAEINKTLFKDDMMFFRTQNKLFCELIRPDVIECF